MHIRGCSFLFLVMALPMWLQTAKGGLRYEQWNEDGSKTMAVKMIVHCECGD